MFASLKCDRYSRRSPAYRERNRFKSTASSSGVGVLRLDMTVCARRISERVSSSGLGSRFTRLNPRQARTTNGNKALSTSSYDGATGRLVPRSPRDRLPSPTAWSPNRNCTWTDAATPHEAESVHSVSDLRDGGRAAATPPSRVFQHRT